MNYLSTALDKLITDFSEENLVSFIDEKTGDFLRDIVDIPILQGDDNSFETIKQVGEIQFAKGDPLLVATIKVRSLLNEKLGKKAQYDLAKRLLRSAEYENFAGGIFAFYDTGGSFRFSLIYAESVGQKRHWSNFKRFTYYVTNEQGITNRTFKSQMLSGDYTSFEGIKDAFSIAAVTDLFYTDFLLKYNELVDDVKRVNSLKDNERANDFVLLFAIRTIFIGFIQKKGWLGNDTMFMQKFLDEYKKSSDGKDKFYAKWLSPLFFESLNKPQGYKPAYQSNDFSKATEEALQMAPYLNGGLFREKENYDDQGLYLPDKGIFDYFEFLFSHSFTIEENSLEDEELQLNPEFLGIIFERLVNKADGAVYTPRTEVDFMCRLSLLKWLQKNLPSNFRFTNLYELFFLESEEKTEQKEGSFSENEIRNILGKLEEITVCDPAVGSGAFLVGMMQVLDEIEESLRKRIGITTNNSYERKKRIIRTSLYGVEVKEWAVWICQLRLWLSLFVDAPDQVKNSTEPILPSLDFKVRKGDSLIQYVGNKIFPINKHPDHLGLEIRKKIEKLKEAKVKFYDNKEGLTSEWLKSYELKIYKDIIQTEIHSKQKEIDNYNNTLDVREQSAFFDTGTNRRYRKMTLLQKIEQYKEDIEELQSQLNVLNGDSKPLIWSIEFAEIFAEKGGFDIIIGNPPYVRQEDIADPTGYIKE
ncbi:MAG: DNA methyltransferase, partial [Candidatus Cloacimonas sp.]|nr:BREX-1 system adenine-specific DNA-methyltransferase PglX [Candidatus Cloacimonadota bacterium]